MDAVRLIPSSHFFYGAAVLELTNDSCMASAHLLWNEASSSLGMVFSLLAGTIHSTIRTVSTHRSPTHQTIFNANSCTSNLFFSSLFSP